MFPLIIWIFSLDKRYKLIRQLNSKLVLIILFATWTFTPLLDEFIEIK